MDSKVHYHVQKIPPIVPILGQINQVQTILYYYLTYWDLAFVYFSLKF